MDSSVATGLLLKIIPDFLSKKKQKTDKENQVQTSKYIQN